MRFGRVCQHCFANLQKSTKPHVFGLEQDNPNFIPAYGYGTQLTQLKAVETMQQQEDSLGRTLDYGRVETLVFPYESTV